MVSPHPARPYASHPEHIIISSSERCSIDCFIDQYIESRALQPNGELRYEVIEVLSGFSGAAQVMLYELNAWLDNRLNLRALHPDYLDIIDECGDFPRPLESRRQVTSQAL